MLRDDLVDRPWSMYIPVRQLTQATEYKQYNHYVKIKLKLGITIQYRQSAPQNARSKALLLEGAS